MEVKNELSRFVRVVTDHQSKVAKLCSGVRKQWQQVHSLPSSDSQSESAKKTHAELAITKAKVAKLSHALGDLDLKNASSASLLSANGLLKTFNNAVTTLELLCSFVNLSWNGYIFVDQVKLTRRMLH